MFSGNAGALEGWSTDGHAGSAVRSAQHHPDRAPQPSHLRHLLAHISPWLPQAAATTHLLPVSLHTPQDGCH